MIPVRSSDTTEGTVSTPELTFAASTWHTRQWVTVTGVADAIPDGDIPYMIELGALATVDPMFRFDPPDIPATNADVFDECVSQGVTCSAAGQECVQQEFEYSDDRLLAERKGS